MNILIFTISSLYHIMLQYMNHIQLFHRNNIKGIEIFLYQIMINIRFFYMKRNWKLKSLINLSVNQFKQKEKWIYLKYEFMYVLPILEEFERLYCVIFISIFSSKFQNFSLDLRNMKIFSIIFQTILIFKMQPRWRFSKICILFSHRNEFNIPYFLLK